MEKNFTEMIKERKTNKIAGLYPSTKFKVVILFSICTIILNTIKLAPHKLALLLIPWFLLVPTIFIISDEFKKCIKSMKPISFIAIFIMLVQTFIVSGGQTLWQWYFLSVREKGLQSAISLGFLILNIAGIFVWVFQTTSTKEISRWLEDTKLSFKAAYIFSSTLEMINVFSTRSKIILDAQRARGVETEGNVITRAKAFIPTLVPLILSGIMGSEDRVLTLEARGFSIKGKKTHLYNLEKSGYEKPVLAISIVIAILILVGRIALWIMK